MLRNYFAARKTAVPERTGLAPRLSGCIRPHPAVNVMNCAASRGWDAAG